MSGHGQQRDFPTARYLDDPVRYSGLTITQWLAGANSCGQGYGAWLLIGFGGPFSLPVGGPWGLGLRVFLCSLWMAATFLVVVLLAGGVRREQFGRQYLGYLLRLHHYAAPGPARERARRKMKGRLRIVRQNAAPPETEAAQGAAPRFLRWRQRVRRGFSLVAPGRDTTPGASASSCGGGKAGRGKGKGGRR